MRLVLLSFSLAAFYINAGAQSINAFKLWLTSGNTIIYKLDECPKITFQDDELIISTKHNTVSYTSADVEKFTHTYVDPTSIDNMKMNDTMFSISGNILNVRNTTSNSPITVYTIDGNVLATTMTNNSGQATLQLPDTSSKVLVVKTQIANFKIIKQ